MNYYIKKFSEFKTTQNTDEIRWDDCVVWKEYDCFVYLESAEIRYVSWSLGIVSIIPHSESILARYFNAILINSPTVLVGKNIKTGN